MKPQQDISCDQLEKIRRSIFVEADSGQPQKNPEDVAPTDLVISRTIALSPRQSVTISIGVDLTLHEWNPARIPDEFTPQELAIYKREYTALRQAWADLEARRCGGVVCYLGG